MHEYEIKIVILTADSYQTEQLPAVTGSVMVAICQGATILKQLPERILIMMMNMTKYYSCSDADSVLLNSCIADTHVPYYDNNAIKNVVRVLDVAKRPIYQQLQEHLQGKETGKHNITDLQCIG